MLLPIFGQPLGQGQLIVSMQTVAQIVEQFDHSPGLRGRPVGINEQGQPLGDAGWLVEGHGDVVVVLMDVAAMANGAHSPPGAAVQGCAVGFQIELLVDLR
jgi:hypothetical protein